MSKPLTPAQAERATQQFYAEEAKRYRDKINRGLTTGERYFHYSAYTFPQSTVEIIADEYRALGWAVQNESGPRSSQWLVFTAPEGSLLSSEPDDLTFTPSLWERLKAILKRNL